MIYFNFERSFCCSRRLLYKRFFLLKITYIKYEFGHQEEDFFSFGKKYANVLVIKL